MIMHKKKEEFLENINRYCDNNIGKKVFLTAFTNLYPMPSENPGIKDILSNKDLVIETSRIVRDLENKKILREVDKSKELSYNPYPRYEILSHERLVEERHSGKS